MIHASETIRAAPRYLGTAYSKLDCQAFVEACMREAGNRTNLAGSNAWYRECMKNGWVGTPEECRKQFGVIPKGAFLFILQAGGEPEKYRGDGIGNASHIGLYTGESGKLMTEQATAYGVKNAGRYNFGDGAIHSSSTRGCVCTSKFAGKAIPGGWNRIGLWNMIQYDLSPGSGSETQALNQEEAKGENQMTTAKVTLPAGASGDTVNVRTGPGKHYPIDFRVPAGSEIRIRTIQDTWYFIEWNGKTGYMMSEYIRLTDAGAESDSEAKAGSDDQNGASPVLPLAQAAALEGALTEIEKQLAVIRAHAGLTIPAAGKE